jgi:uncharacterized protein (TIGR03663 family)
MSATSAKNVNPERDLPDPSRTAWRIACAAILIVAGLLRLLYLTEKVLHHDEGVNGLFMASLFRRGFYHYDPSNYHGPTLYYFGLLTTTLNSFLYGKYGLSTFAVRLVPALFGIGMVWLVFYFRRSIGMFGSLAGALLVAVSPGFVFFSRYFIHEILFVFFTLSLAVTVMRYRETARPLYLMLASASAASLFATKETYIITAAVLMLALLCAHLYMSFRTKLARNPAEGKSLARKKAVASPKQGAEHGSPRRIHQWIAAGALFATIYVLFYSSFFTNFPKGVYDSVRTFGYWGHTGVTQYLSPWSTYVKWLSREELPAMVLGGLGIIVALYQARSRFAVFSAFWALGMTAAYSLLPYKTPWLALNPLLPIVIMAGYFLGQWFDLGAKEQSPLLRISAVFALLVGVAASSYQAIDLSFFSYDDDSIPYVYAHTRRDFLGLVDEIETVASHNPAGKNIGVTVMSPEHWPLPWYLREYPNCGYYGTVVPTSEPVIVALQAQSEQIEKTAGTLYRRFHSYELRPGVSLVLYLRRDQRP